ncbi:hypothetical protein ZIOFF_038764 [Zingiber officinale]|uniref:Uncharacterized protein n=1 Tax=Zingiber officinale TaxID=94328 RepID=A0A8J5G145_ZINOF|nr:hypothetical protein ZIOFF_038764 [Zingiber officinale]
MDSNKLTRPNFLDWFQNMRIVLKAKKLVYVLEKVLSTNIADDVIPDQILAFEKQMVDSELVSCIMLASMSPELQKQHDHMDAYLYEQFDEQARFEQFEVTKLLFCSKMQEGSFVFVMNYQMNRIEFTIPELINMLKDVEPSVKKEKKTLMIVDSLKKVLIGNQSVRALGRRKRPR